MIAIADPGRADCASAVKSVLSETNGQLLSVRVHPDRCTVVVLIFTSGERPQKKTIRVFHKPSPIDAQVEAQQSFSDDRQSL